MTKIMFVLTTYEIGGASRVVKNLLDCLDADKFDMVLVTQRSPCRDYSIDNCIRLINLDISPQKRPFAKIQNVVCHLISLRKIIVAEAPDVILSFTAPVNCYVLFSLLFRLSKKPKIIISEHSEQMFLRIKSQNIKQAVLEKIYGLAMFLLYHKADYIVTVSKTIAQHVKKFFLVSPHKVKVIYNPVNINKIKELCKEDDSLSNFNDALPLVGTISRLSFEKGIHFLIQGFKDLLDKIDARLIIVGDGMERSRLEQLVADLDIKEKVIFTGWEANPFKYLVKMDIFILPSLWEGFSNVILEAMVCGVPVIASDSKGGVREAIKNGINGLLIEPESPPAISKSIYCLLSSKEKRERIVKKAYETVKQFDLGAIKRQYETLILG